jgi:integrase
MMRVTSERPTKITKATVDATWRQRKTDQRAIVRDKECRGLALIVNPTGMTWTFSYRPRGTDPDTGRRWPNRSITLGNPSTHSPDDARAEANRIKGRTAAGEDPSAEKKARAAEEQRKRVAALGRLVQDYGEALPRRQKMRGPGRPSPNYVAEELSQLRLALVDLNAEKMAASDIKVSDLRRWLDGEGGRNHRARFGALSRFLDWCQDVGHVEANPCALLPRARRPKTLQPRTHYLSPEQMGRLWRAAGDLREPVWRDFARFLIAVPCRRGEAAHLDWSHINLVTAEWHQPGHMTKNRDPHRLYLHPLALDVLRARLDLTAGKGLVFPAPKSGQTLETFTALKKRIGEAAGLQAWTWHDFRRSFASALGEEGISETVADAILNHRQSATRGGVLGVYQRSSRWPEQVRAMELWGRLLAATLDEGETDQNVVPMAARTG